MGKRVTTIPATLNLYDSVSLKNPQKRKVAGYARVSKDIEEQATSYAAQVDYYTAYIKKNPEWEFAGIYTDEGITATTTKKRNGFKQMIADALAGKIDLIITKSVSRFARNTVDSLTTVRELKENGIEIYFEKENIWTFDSKGELLITIMSSLAQEESRSISENVKWGKRRAFANGKGSLSFNTFLGYDRGPNGEFVINEEQAATVRYIYEKFLEGFSAYRIAKDLTEMGIKTPGGKEKWANSSVLKILKNEKYKGDLLFQKTYIKDFLSHKSVRNNGEIPQYYIEDHHEGIITAEQFDQVQLELYRRKKIKKYSGISIFSSILKCGNCGGWYGSKVWNSNTKYKKTIYQCNKKYKNRCKTPNLSEYEIKQLFVQVVNQLISEKEEIKKNTEEMKKTICDMNSLTMELKDKTAEINTVVEQINNIVIQNSKVSLNQDEYNKEYFRLKRKYDTIASEIDRLSKQIKEKDLQGKLFDNFISTFKKQNETISEFDEFLWSGLVYEIVVYTKQDVRFFLKNGLEIDTGL